MRPRARGWDQRGQALVELAIVLPFVLLLLLGTLEFGLMFDAYLGVSHAAREGARVGIIPGTTDAEIRDRIYAAAPQLDRTRMTITITPSDSSRRSGDPLTVRVEYQYRLVVPLLASLIGDTVSLNRTYTMRVE